jgi:cell division protein FtsN
MPSFERGAYEPSDDVRVFDGAVDDEHDEEGSRLPLLIVIGLLVFAMFAGVVWLAYTQGVAKGRSDAPRMIVADTGPVKTAPSNPGGTQTPYTGLKIYQSPAPPDDANDEESAPAAPTPAGPSAQNATPAISPSLAPVIRPSAPPADATPKVVAAPTPAPAATKLAQNAPPRPAPAATPTVTSDSSAPPTESRVATKPPTKLSSAATPSKLIKPQNPHIPVSDPRPISASKTPTPSPAAVETQSAKPAASTDGGAYLLQIGAYKSEEEATGAWHAYQGKHPVVGGYESDIKKVDLGDKGTWYRLRVGSFDDKTEAAALCDKLKADGGNCFLAKP